MNKDSFKNIIKLYYFILLKQVIQELFIMLNGQNVVNFYSAVNMEVK